MNRITNLAISLDELYPPNVWHKPKPPIGASIAEWKAYRGESVSHVRLPRPVSIHNPVTRRVMISGKKGSVVVTPEFVETVRALALKFTDTDIAIKLGCARSTIQNARWKNKIAPFVKARRVGRPSVAVPSWCPPEFVEEFRARIYGRGQFDAAKWLRNRLSGKTPRGPAPASVSGGGE